MSRILTIRCPDCGAVLQVDSATGAVLDHRPAERRQAEIDLQHAADQLRKQESERDSRFRNSVEAQKRRDEILARKFEESLRKAKQDPQAPLPPRDIDLD